VQASKKMRIGGRGATSCSMQAKIADLLRKKGLIITKAFISYIIYHIFLKYELYRQLKLVIFF